MSKKEIATGVMHSVPEDLRKALIADRIALSYWEDITPLARNEWICWVEDAKKQETRRNRIERGARNSKKGFAGLVVGLVAPIERNKASGNEPMSSEFHGNSA